MNRHNISVQYTIVFDPRLFTNYPSSIVLVNQLCDYGQYFDIPASGHKFNSMSLCALQIYDIPTKSTALHWTVRYTRLTLIEPFPRK